MANPSAALALHRRPDVEYTLDEATSIGEVARPLSVWERIWGNAAVRHITVLVVFGLVWELAARYADNPLIFPSLSETWMFEQSSPGGY